MNLGKMKTLAIVLLLVMDIVFFVALSNRVRSASYYDATLIHSAEESYQESNLFVERRFLTAKIPSLSVYTGKAKPELPDKIHTAFTLSSYTAEREAGGLRYQGGEDSFFFGDDFSFLYLRNGETQKPSELLFGGEYPLQDNRKTKESLKTTVFAFLDRYHIRSVVERAGYSLNISAYYGSGGAYIVSVNELLDGMPTDATLYFRVSAGQVLSVDGTLSVFAPDRRMTSDSVGLMQILFMEKNRLDDEFLLSGSIERDRKILSLVAYSYATYFDTDGSFYYVPMLSLSYMDGEVRQYNYVSGKVYD